ncbi:hypothetical protein DPMN_171576 [Dreissena polymorpha]|uniref:Chitin-binding type-2 domain-containing protein n=1 Tax=Dreissena polymorpha TaxID=45954 RepID=A0A9D4DY92_DREPO|nr:hypothetical protein DPMN_171575 [Dreissena polymorpha]KAH3770292.1 hypothetical protein DPMN_171576 [Dreissena polymorpha]
MWTIRCILFLVSSILINGQLFESLCDEFAMKERSGYNEHPSDCGKYIQCLTDTRGQLFGVERDCAYSTYWNIKLLTCILATDTVCRHDLCHGITDGRKRKDQANCRGYWECNGGKSIPMCCPRGQNYDLSRGCVDNEKDANVTCGDTCMDSVYDPNAFGGPGIKDQTKIKPGTTGNGLILNALTSVEPTPDVQNKEAIQNTVLSSRAESASTKFERPCDKTAVDRHRQMYEQHLQGGWTVRRLCSVGTVFVQASCNCLPDRGMPRP